MYLSKINNRKSCNKSVIIIYSQNRILSDSNLLFFNLKEKICFNFKFTSCKNGMID